MNNHLDKVNKKLEKINSLIDTKMLHLFNKKNLVLSTKTLKELKTKVNTLEQPKKDTKVYLIRLKIDKNDETPLIISCSQYTLTKEFELYPKDDDPFQTITYTNEELIKYGFKMGHIQRIIKAIKDHLISFKQDTVSITKIIKLFEK